MKKNLKTIKKKLKMEKNNLPIMKKLKNILKKFGKNLETICKNWKNRKIWKKNKKFWKKKMKKFGKKSRSKNDFGQLKVVDKTTYGVDGRDMNKSLTSLFLIQAYVIFYYERPAFVRIRFLIRVGTYFQIK